MVRIPDDKRYFRIGEASGIIGVEPYVLRYWETEFPQIRPQRADSNQRTYQRKDLEILLEIKRLLYDDKMTIEGAKQRLRQGETKKAADSKVFKNTEIFEDIKRELQEILRVLT
jgi:DNA-binding transcriptional MerR regulator